MALMLRILIGLCIGAILGIVAPEWTGITLFGHLFVSALKAIAPVLVFVLVSASLAKARSGLGQRFRTLIACYVLSTFIAAISAVLFSFIYPINLQLQEATHEGDAPGQLSDVFYSLATNMVTNPLTSISDANYVGILFWALMAGMALKACASKQTISVVSDISEVIALVVKWVIQFAPFGIMGLVFNSVSKTGLGIFSVYGNLVLLLMICMFSTALIFNPLLAFILTWKNPYPLLFTCLKTSGLAAFFTRSSAANIPVNMDLCKKLELDEDFYSVSIPLGATINMDGAAATITVMTLAVANTMGVEVTLPTAIVLSIVATLGACGASGVAGGSLLLIPLACSFLGIQGDIAMQAVAVGFIIGVIQDSVETALNSSSDVFFTATAEYYDRKKRLPHK
jgi:serine/threonine transporter